MMSQKVLDQDSFDYIVLRLRKGFLYSEFSLIAVSTKSHFFQYIYDQKCINIVLD